jgi:hypothetical protein
MSQKSFKIKFVGAEFISKNLSQPPDEILKDQKPQDFNFDFLVDVKVDAPRNSALALTDLSISDKGKKNILSSYKTICVFELQDFDKLFIKVADNQYDMDVDLEIILKSTAISTTRGMIISELKGTYLHGAILPLVDMASLIKAQRAEREKQNRQPT